MLRRDLLRSGAAIALPLAAAGTRWTERKAAAAFAAEPSGPLEIGIATLGFQDQTNAELARELAEQGIRTVQLFLNQADSRYWNYNGRSDLSDMTPERCEAIADAYRSSGVAIHSMGVYTNLLHADPAEREANLSYFDAMMAIGQRMGVKRFVTESGHYHPDPALDRPWVPYYLRDEVWPQMVDTFGQLVAMAQRRGATVLIEPNHCSFFTSAKRTRLFLEEIGSPHLRALLDPANLIEVNDQEEMYDQLGPWIDCIHAKDRKLHVVEGVAAGHGDLDYKKFVTLAAQRRPGVPVIMEYVGPENYKQAHAHLLAAMNEVGMGER